MTKIATFIERDPFEHMKVKVQRKFLKDFFAFWNSKDVPNLIVSIEIIETRHLIFND